MVDEELASEKIPCEHCGKNELRGKMKKKRYCSPACAKSQKHDQNSQKSGNADEELLPINSCSLQGDNNNGAPDTPAMNELQCLESSTPVARWSVKEVCRFVADLLGTDDYTEDFTNHEIDGSALVLLQEKHLVNAMAMKLGPALKIVARVQSLQGTDSDQAQNSSSANSNQ